MSVAGSTATTVLLEPGGEVWPTEPDAGLLGALLTEQHDLSAVARFAQFYDHIREPEKGGYYSALLPASPPGPGQQLAFEVDLDRCSGCKACVTACHNLNGLDPGESWRDVSLMLGGLAELPVLQHVTSSCHHCLAPACLNACPADAYEKDPLTGIVRHLDDQCIGCQYCAFACPYDAPKYNVAKGIVRKCDMCHDRLALGEAPACAGACPHQAIRIRVVSHAEVVARSESGHVLSAAPDPAYTLPTTALRTSHLVGPGNMRTVDDHHFEPEHAHWALVVMLVLTQLSVGGFAVELAGLTAGLTGGFGAWLHPTLSLWVGWVGLGVSVLHLGRPRYAYRALIGLRHSWLSREVLAFMLFAGLATVYVALALLAPDWLDAAWDVRAALLGLIVATGSAGVACSMLVYHVVRRPYWHATQSGPKFFGTALVLGLATALAALACSHTARAAHANGALAVVALFLIAATCSKLFVEARLSRGFARSELAALMKTAALLDGRLRRPAGLRRFLGLVGGVVVPAVSLMAAALEYPGTAGTAAVFALVVLTAGEIAERYLFFAGMVKPTLPGGLSR